MKHGFDNRQSIKVYHIFAFLMTLVGMAIVVRAFYIMTAEKEYWVQVSNRLKRDSLLVTPARGNIFSCDGQLMASSLPEYRVFMDFKAGDEKKRDSIWLSKADSLAEGLHQVFPEKSAAEFRSHLEKGRKKGARHWPVYPRRIDYNSFQLVTALPYFNLGRFSSGFHYETTESRKKPFGSLASYTVGAIWGSDSAKYGLEWKYDKELRGSKGYKRRRKVKDKILHIVDQPADDGADLVTTIDVGMQDLAERALLDMMKELTASAGTAVVMEVKTGDVKAIVNMVRNPETGRYGEGRNVAVADILEPGSVFKTVSLMVALENGIADTATMVETGNGQLLMHGRVMKDHNWRRGGYGNISLARAIEVSSNIGVSRIIDQYYQNKPEEYVKAVRKTGIDADLQLPFKHAIKPRIRMPKKDKWGHYTNWYGTALPWMSIGYETQVPAISTLTFYNAIANNGRMMKPRFVSKIVKDGEVVKEILPECINPKICSDKTVKTVQVVLEHVVSQGLGKKAGSRNFKVAGKTGTAQISAGAGGYTKGFYLASFCGFFPADQPRYSCIVCIQENTRPGSGGGMAGPVFRKIAEGVMAKDLKMMASEARDTNSVFIPDVKCGNVMAADYVLSNLDVFAQKDWTKTMAYAEPVWGRAESDNRSVNLIQTKSPANLCPNVCGMGARDAVYLLEKRGLKVKLKGRGKVTKQSYQAGREIKIGSSCELLLG